MPVYRADIRFIHDIDLMERRALTLIVRVAVLKVTYCSLNKSSNHFYTKSKKRNGTFLNNEFDRFIWKSRCDPG